MPKRFSSTKGQFSCNIAAPYYLKGMGLTVPYYIPILSYFKNQAQYNSYKCTHFDPFCKMEMKLEGAQT